MKFKLLLRKPIISRFKKRETINICMLLHLSAVVAVSGPGVQASNWSCDRICPNNWVRCIPAATPQTLPQNSRTAKQMDVKLHLPTPRAQAAKRQGDNRGELDWGLHGG